MKRIMIVLAFSMSLSSCALFESNKAQLEKTTDECIKEIELATNNQLANAKHQINQTFIQTIKDATVNIDSLVTKSTNDIKAATQESIKQNTQKIQNELKSNARKSVLGIMLGGIAFLIGIFNVILLISIKKQLRGKVEDYCYESDRLERKIKNIVSSEITEERRRRKTTISTHDLEEQIQNVLSNKNVIESIKCKLNTQNISSIEQQPVTTQTVKTNTTDVVKPMRPEPQYILYARDSCSNVLNEISTTHLIGKTIYKLSLKDQQSTEAEIDLNTEQPDVVKRVLGVDNSQLDQICEIHRITDNPTTVIVNNKGKAQKTGSAQWTVIKKIEIELK